MTDVTDLLAKLPPHPQFDFSEFGEVETVAVSRVQQLTGAFLSRNWVTIPHVTHHDEVDVEVVENWRKEGNAAGAFEAKVTLLPLLFKALVDTLRQFPHFNASLVEGGKKLAVKHYYNIGFAVDSPQGLLVPVIRDVDKKTVSELALEIAALAEKARTKGLSMDEMSGSTFCVSSLGHIGGTAFTPIINAPDVAILGVTRMQERPVKADDGGVDWRKKLSLSLSYDHRVINGADAARFVIQLGESLGNLDIYKA